MNSNKQEKEKRKINGISHKFKKGKTYSSNALHKVLSTIKKTSRTFKHRINFDIIQKNSLDKTFNELGEAIKNLKFDYSKDNKYKSYGSNITIDDDFCK